MKPLESTDLNDISEDDMIAFQRTNKDGTVVSLLGFVSRINLSADKTEITNFELLPMVPSDQAPDLNDVETFEIDYEKDVQYSGLDAPHKVYGMSFKVTPDHFPQGSAPRLGYLHEGIAGRLCAFADNAQERNQKHYNLHPDVVAGIGFPPMQLRMRDRSRQQNTGQNTSYTMELKKTAGYEYTPVENGREQPYIQDNPWQDFVFK